MTNLLTVLPDFNVHPFTHILHSLEKARISTADLITLDPTDVAKRAHLPPGEVKKLADAVLESLHVHLDAQEKTHEQTRGTISTLDDELDALLGRGIQPRHVTEFVGESAVGKTQFLLTLLLAVQLPPPHGLGKSALYISTEAPLQTTRLSQILKTNPKLAALPTSDQPSLNRVQSIHLHDLEAQEHILRYQVPVAVARHSIGLLIVDSIAANYRPEFGKGPARKSAESFAQRSHQLSHLGALLHHLASTNDLAIVVANQVADRFAFPDPVHPTQQTQISRPDSPAVFPADSSVQLNISTDDPLALDHQQRFFSGWGNDRSDVNLKTPSLGLTWSNQLSTRIALLKEPIYEERTYEPGEERSISDWNRTFKVAFSAWCAGGAKRFEIFPGGVRSSNNPQNDVAS